MWKWKSSEEIERGKCGNGNLVRKLKEYERGKYGNGNLVRKLKEYKRGKCVKEIQ